MNKLWYPVEVWYEEAVRRYPLGKAILEMVNKLDIPCKPIEAHNKARLEIEEPGKRFVQSKKILVLGTKKDTKLIPCQPSADYRIVLGTSCPAFCEYCYLADSLGERVFPRVYVNLEDILKPVYKVLSESDKPVSFELSSSGDPLATEHLTGLLGTIIERFGMLEKGTLRVVTKFPNVEGLLRITHNNKTFFRFSLNTEYVIKSFEHGTADLNERITACQKLVEAGYPLGAIIAPIFIYRGYEKDYRSMLAKLAQEVPQIRVFELISYRFSKRSKDTILKRFPNTKLPFPKTGIRHKAFGKYVYDEKTTTELKDYFQTIIKEYFPESSIGYFV